MATNARPRLESTTFPPFARLALAYAIGVAGDVFVTVSLADTLFFSATTSAARPKVLLYLLLTLAPFAVVAPVFGPLIDRTRSGRRLTFAATMAARAVLCLIMAEHVNGYALYPLAFAALVLSKTQSVTKSALVPGVIKNKGELVLANSRLAFISILGGIAAGPLAAVILRLAGAPWVLRTGSVIFLIGVFAAFGLPRAKVTAPAESADQRDALHSRSVLAAGTAMGLLRGAVGFFTFFAAFVLKSRGEPAWLYGVVLMMSAVGTGLGTVLAPLLRRRTREEWILAGALVVPSIPLVFAARAYGRAALVVAAMVIAAASGLGRLAFDSLLQRDGADAARGRAFARFETRFQLVWVLGGLLAVVFPGGGRGGIFLVALVLLFAGLSYVGAVRRPAPGGRNPSAGINPPEQNGRMPIVVRPITEDELPAFNEIDRRGFGAAPRPPERADSWVRAELDRTRCAFEGTTMVGCTRAYTFELTMPGGRLVPAAGVSSVSVQPTHRRQGVLSRMLDVLHGDARDRGEVASVLTASESVIYKRFGYGAATWRLGCSLTREYARLARPVPDPGRMRLVARGEADALYRDVYDDVRRARAGMVTRPDAWWPEVFWITEPGRALFDAVHEDAEGRADGYVSYEIKGEWYGGFADRDMVVWDLQATNPVARAALWEYVFGVDLVAKIVATNLPADEPLRFMLADPRRLRTEFFNDSLWLLPLDVATLLGARTYSTAGTLTIEVVDPGAGSSRFVLDGGPDGASCREVADAVPDLSCSRSTLGALLLGGNSWALLAEALGVDEHTPGAIARADAMFATAPAPATLTWF